MSLARWVCGRCAYTVYRELEPGMWPPECPRGHGSLSISVMSISDAPRGHGDPVQVRLPPRYSHQYDARSFFGTRADARLPAAYRADDRRRATWQLTEDDVVFLRVNRISPA